jgi:hypothetical protein
MSRSLIGLNLAAILAYIVAAHLYMDKHDIPYFWEVIA